MYGYTQELRNGADFPTCYLQPRQIQLKSKLLGQAGPALQDACVCMSVCMWPYTENLNSTNALSHESCCNGSLTIQLHVDGSTESDCGP